MQFFYIYLFTLLIKTVSYQSSGGMAERLNALVLKTSKGLYPSRVQIPVPPPLKSFCKRISISLASLTCIYIIPYMKSRTRVVVIGGGIAGCSTLYHLTQEGRSDAFLIERYELTSGTTWHSSAQLTMFAMN